MTVWEGLGRRLIDPARHPQWRLTVGPIKSWWLVLHIVLDLLVLQGPPWATPCQARKVNAFQRLLQASDQIGVRGILVHAASPAARAFYLPMGFESSPLDPSTLMVRLSDVRDALLS
jgi:hypothetical protein